MRHKRLIKECLTKIVSPQWWNSVWNFTAHASQTIEGHERQQPKLTLTSAARQTQKPVNAEARLRKTDNE
jgi:hypothetical protein